MIRPNIANAGWCGSNIEKTSRQAEVEILGLIAELDRGRILSIADRAEKRGIKTSLRNAQSRISAGEVKTAALDKPELKLWLENCPFITVPSLKTSSPAVPAKLITWASQARWDYSELLPHLFGFDPKQYPSWLDSLYKIARYHAAIKSMIKLAAKQPEIFTDICITEIRAPEVCRFSIANEKATLLTVVKNLVRDDAAITIERLQKHLDTPDTEKKLRNACKLELTLHAEMQIVVFYAGNPSLVPRMPFIGTSKKACFLCYEYLLQHPLRLQVSACHQKIYPSWMPPPYYPVPGKFKSAPFTRLSRSIEQLTRRELKSALTIPRRARTQDSTAGPSLTISEAIAVISN